MQPEREAIASLWLGSLPPLPPSPGNPVADDPRAVALGHRLFFDPRFSANGATACASCHRPEHHFKDDAARSRGIGLTARKSMSVVGAAYSPWLFWDGRRDSLWSQALEPLEDPLEHGTTRVEVARALRERVETEFARADAVERTQPALQHEVEPAVAGGLLDRQPVGDETR